ncbi:MAG TPA: nitroreductase family deazaflavin-dependent oxidoreductase [Trebonia sp.]
MAGTTSAERRHGVLPGRDRSGAHSLVLHSTTHVPQGWQRHGAAIDWTWCFALSQPAPQRTRVRLRVRGKTAPWWLTTLYQVAIVPADYVMATGMLRGLKRRVEARSPPAASGRQPLDQATYGTSVASRSADRSGTPLWGLRRQPGRLALAVFRLPLRLYRRSGRLLLGDTFLLLVHAGRKTGQPYSTVAMVLRHDPHSGEAVICSAWGKDADWVRNIQAHPALKVQIGRESFTPDQRFLSPDESAAVLAGFQRRHPYRARLLASVLGWGDLRSEAAAREFVSTRPFVSFRPFSPGREPSEGDGHD